MRRAIWTPALIVAYVATALVWRHAADPSVSVGPLPVPPPAHLAGPSVIAPELPARTSPGKPSRRVRLTTPLHTPSVTVSLGPALQPGIVRHSPIRPRTPRAKPSTPSKRAKPTKPSPPGRGTPPVTTPPVTTPRPAPSAPPSPPSPPTPSTPIAAPATTTPPARDPASSPPVTPTVPPVVKPPVVTPPVVMPPVVTPPLVTPPVVTPPVETRPGNGWGDTNHEHTGPPGQQDKDKEKDKGGKH